MALTVDTTNDSSNHYDTVRHRRVRVTGTSVLAATDVVIEDVPEFFSITHLDVTGGGAITMTPAFGKGTGWTDSTEDEIAIYTGATFVHDNTVIRGHTSTGTIYFRPGPGSSATVTANFTLVDGHIP